MAHKPLIGLMLGDVTGIGPELVVKLLCAPETRAQADILLVGDARVLELGMRDAGQRIAYTGVASVEEADFAGDAIPFLDLGNVDPALFERGRMNPESG